MTTTKEDYMALESAILQAFDGQLLQLIRDSYARRGLSETRFLFDVFYQAQVPSEIICNIYKYANDKHLETSLRKIIMGAIK